MSKEGRLTSIAGGTFPIPTIPSATILEVPEEWNTIEVSGTTAITSISTQYLLPGRHLTMLGTDDTGPAFTDTAVASTANGLIHLSAAMTLGLGKTLTLVQANNGSWWEVARAVNG